MFPTTPTTRSRPSTTRRRSIGKLTVLVLGARVLVGGANAVASASSTNHYPSRPHTIHIVTTLGSAAVNSAGRGSVADVVEFVQDFVASNGAREHAYVSCQTFPGPLNLFGAVVNFPDGEIDLEAEIPLPPTTFTSDHRRHWRVQRGHGRDGQRFAARRQQRPNLPPHLSARAMNRPVL